MTHTTRTAHQLAAALGLPPEAADRWLHDARADDRRATAQVRTEADLLASGELDICSWCGGYDKHCDKCDGTGIDPIQTRS